MRTQYGTSKGLLAVSLSILRPPQMMWHPGCVSAALAMLLGTTAIAGFEEVLEQKPLAEVAVQELPGGARNPSMSRNPLIARYQTAGGDSLASYKRGSDGRWSIPADVDRTNPWLRLLVLAPHRPLIVDMAIFLDGQPHGAAREELIDELLSSSQEESQPRQLATKSESNSAQGDTQPAEDASDTDSDAVADESATTEEKESTSAVENEDVKNESELPLVDVRGRANRSLKQRLLNYLVTTDVEADRTEVRWLIAEWAGGPALISLGPAANWQRAGVAPLWNLLDLNRDETLSAAEVQGATQRLSHADIDENGTAELDELAAMVREVRSVPRSYPLAVVLSPATDWQQLYGELVEVYGRRGAMQQGNVQTSASVVLGKISAQIEELTPADLPALLAESANVSLRVSLEANAPRIALLAAENFVGSSPEYFVGDHLLSIVYGATFLEFSAGQTAPPDASQPDATQIAVGAVDDGYPLFRLLDHNGDRRLSARERRSLQSQLNRLDLNHDGQISAEERPTAIRIAVTRGPHAHELLAMPMSATYYAADAKPTESETPKVAPAWFTDMDRNRDGDLSRAEFLGTSAQFAGMDRDGDGLISMHEAQPATD